jgi:hypothetical protein
MNELSNSDIAVLSVAIVNWLDDLFDDNSNHLSTESSLTKAFKESKKRKYENELAESLLLNELLMRPGRGFMAFGRTPKADSVPPFNIGMIDNALNFDYKCLEIIQLLPDEFNHILGFVTLRINQDTRFVEGKAPLRAQLFMLFYFLKNNNAYRELEFIFGLAKSSCKDNLFSMAAIVLDVIKSEMRSLWPSRPQRDLMRTFLPDILRLSGLFFFVDSSKKTNVDSCDTDTRRLHWNTHKRFGSNAIYFTDLLGQLIHIETGLHGSSGDLPQYRETDAFLQRNGITWDDDEVIYLVFVSIYLFSCLSHSVRLVEAMLLMLARQTIDCLVKIYCVKFLQMKLAHWMRQIF